MQKEKAETAVTSTNPLTLNSPLSLTMVICKPASLNPSLTHPSPLLEAHHPCPCARTPGTIEQAWVGAGKQRRPVGAPGGGAVVPASESWWRGARPSDRDWWCCLLGVRQRRRRSSARSATPTAQSTNPWAPHWIRYGWGLLLDFPGVVRFRWCSFHQFCRVCVFFFPFLVCF